jgi:hypothetical protein
LYYLNNYFQRRVHMHTFYKSADGLFDSVYLNF